MKKDDKNKKQISASEKEIVSKKENKEYLGQKDMKKLKDSG